jgi:hypothetical protein
MNHANTSFSTEICAGAIISVVQYLAPLRYLSAVATTQLAMRHGPAEFRPFDGPSGAQLCLQWEGLHDTAETLWRLEDREVSQDSMGTIAEAQCAYCRHSAQARADALLASLHDGTEGGKRARARLLSCACNTSFSVQNLGGKTILAPLRSPKAYMLFGCA